MDAAFVPKFQRTSPRLNHGYGYNNKNLWSQLADKKTGIIIVPKLTVSWQRDHLGTLLLGYTALTIGGEFELNLNLLKKNYIQTSIVCKQCRFRQSFCRIIFETSHHIYSLRNLHYEEKAQEILINFSHASSKK